MKDFKVGDTVVVKNLDDFNYQETPTINYHMSKLSGKTFNIKRIKKNGNIYDGTWQWLPKWLKHIHNAETIKATGYKLK